MDKSIEQRVMYFGSMCVFNARFIEKGHIFTTNRELAIDRSRLLYSLSLKQCDFELFTPTSEQECYKNITVIAMHRFQMELIEKN